MPDLYERWVSHYTICAHIKGKPEVKIDLKQALEIIKKKISAKSDPFFEPPPPEEARFITNLKDIDFTILPGKAVIFFVSLDKQKRSILGNERTFELREPDRTDEEQWAATAHMVINLEPYNGRYLVVLEEVEGLSASRISYTMNWILGRATTYTINPSPKKDKKYLGRFDLSKLANVDLVKDLAEGELLMLELSRQPTDEEMEAAPLSPPREIFMKMKVLDSARGSGAVAVVKRLIGTKLVDDYPTMHISYRDKDGKHRTAVEELTPGQQELTNLIHRKTMLPRFAEPLPAAPIEVVKPLAKAMSFLAENENA